MEETSGSRLLDIRKTVEKHKQLASSLPDDRAVTACDSTRRIYGIRKKKALKTASKMKNALARIH